MKRQQDICNVQCNVRYYKTGQMLAQTKKVNKFSLT